MRTIEQLNGENPPSSHRLRNIFFYIFYSFSHIPTEVSPSPSPPSLLQTLSIPPLSSSFSLQKKAGPSGKGTITCNKTGPTFHINAG